MSKRPRRTYHVEAEVTQPTLTPDSGLRITLKQALVAAGVIIGAAGIGYAFKSELAETRRDVSDIKKTQEQFTANTPAALKDQDEKRARLGEAFLASNKVIADKVGELATAVAVQQADARATREALTKISEQLQQLNARGTVRR